jgi:hypothetical protein
MERTFDTIYEEALSVVKSVNVPEEYRTILLEALENARKDRDVDACSIVCLSAIMGEFKHECLTRFDTLGTAMLDVQKRVSKLEEGDKVECEGTL